VTFSTNGPMIVYSSSSIIKYLHSSWWTECYIHWCRIIHDCNWSSELLYTN